MEATENQNGVFSGGNLIAGGCILLALVGMLLPSRSPAPLPAMSAPPAKKAPAKETANPYSWAPGAEPRVTFAHTMPRGPGTQVVNNTGTLNPEMVMVGIPDGPKKVRFVRGTDPVAQRYLAETKAAQERKTFDRGPTDVDTSQIGDFGPLKGRATRRIGNFSPDAK